MDITIGIVSRNLVTYANFDEFRNSRIFHKFREDGRRTGEPQKQDFYKKSQKLTIYKECPFKIIGT